MHAHTWITEGKLFVDERTFPTVKGIEGKLFLDERTTLTGKDSDADCERYRVRLLAI